MTYAHAINLINENQIEGIPVWLYGLCNADFVNTRPNFVTTWHLDKVFVRSDGTLFEMLEDYE